MNILTVEEMSNNVGEIVEIITKCRSKTYLLQTQFEPIVRGGGGDTGIDDDVLWAMGLQQLCKEILEDLTVIYDLSDHVCESIELCSIDNAKVEKQKTYLKSIGIQNP